jgi:phosphoglycerate dehydrogenase-like enzyme
MPLRVLIDMPVQPRLLADLQRLEGVTVDLLPGTEVTPVPRPAEVPVDLTPEIDAMFCTYPPVNIDRMRKLRFIQISSAGYSQLFGLNLTERGIRAGNARGCFDVPIAEWNVAMIVNLARDLRQMIRNQDSQVWDRGARFQSEVRGLTVGLWGYGGIGRETARLLRAMGLRVHVLSRTGIGPVENVYAVPGTGDPEGVLPHRVFLAGEELAFLAELDFLILAMPLTPATEGIVGERELRALPRSAFLLNPARGPLVQETALLRALEEGWIAGAAIDTHYHYPLPPEHPVWRAPNVILTPHISGSGQSPYFLDRVWDIFVENMRRFISGRPLLNELTPAQLSGA